ncbi:MAG: tRNA isopentenyl-2-thiomethyl-A-37 hydroxylase MiaE [Polyangiaceae bacterium]
MLGLLIATKPEWAPTAAASVDRVLVDHAHCEMKAASNALSLTPRCAPWPAMVRTLVDLAEEELTHMRRVLDELERRGIPFGAPEVDFYAAELRKRTGPSSRHRGAQPGDVDRALVDRLLVAALIEARSCERFKLLRDALSTKDSALSAFYDDLLASEARHYGVFVDMAATVSGSERDARARLAEVAAIEASVVRELPCTPTIHG